MIPVGGAMMPGVFQRARVVLVWGLLGVGSVGSAMEEEWGRTIPPLEDMLAGCTLLAPGDIPDFDYPAPTNVLFVATAEDGGRDTNDGRSLDEPLEHIETAIEYANAHPEIPLTIYVRRGIHSYKHTADYDYQEITRGNLLISGWADEEAIIRPRFWPDLPFDWGSAHALVARGSFEKLGVERLIFEGWGTVFYLGSPLASPPMSNVWFRSITARQFKHRGGDPDFLRTFFETDTLPDDVYGEGKNMATNFAGAHYQIEKMVMAQCRISEADLAVNIGDENDANVRGLRISDVVFRHSGGGPGEGSANDGLAIVNSYKVLIDHCTLENIQDDGIDTKSEDVAVVNCFVQGAGRNAVKFWLSGEMINTIVYDSTPLDDGAVIFDRGPARIVNCLLMEKSVGYAGTMNYENAYGSDRYRFEVVNTLFVDLANPFYYRSTNVSIRNNLFDGQQSRLFDRPAGPILEVAQLNSTAGCSNNVQGLPRLIAPLSNDFSPGYGSAALEAGATSGVVMPAFDFYGRPRVIGSAPDIGPIEYDPARADSDGDGVSDGDEIEAGTQPTNRADFLAITSLRCGKETVLQWRSVSNRTYEIHAAAEVSGPWTSVPGGTNLPGTGATAVFTNQESAGYPLWRVSMHPP